MVWKIRLNTSILSIHPSGLDYGSNNDDKDDNDDDNDDDDDDDDE